MKEFLNRHHKWQLPVIVLVLLGSIALIWFGLRNWGIHFSADSGTTWQARGGDWIVPDPERPTAWIGFTNTQSKFMSAARCRCPGQSVNLPARRGKRL